MSTELGFLFDSDSPLGLSMLLLNILFSPLNVGPLVLPGPLTDNAVTDLPP